MLPLKVINIYGGPCAGKSVLAAGLFNLMKACGHNVELVTEVAKDFTYGKDWQSLDNQLLILGLQDQRLRRLVGNVEWAITDSPLPIGLAYVTDEYRELTEPAIWGAFDRYENYDVWLSRGAFPYQTTGRNQTEHQALILDTTLRDIYTQAVDGDVDFAMETVADLQAPARVYNWLMWGEELEDQQEASPKWSGGCHHCNGGIDPCICPGPTEKVAA